MALHGKKGFSASQTKRTSRRVSDSMIGSHVARPSVSRGRHGADRSSTGTSRVDFSDSHRSRRATRGFVDQIDPQATSGESDADFARRANRRGYAEQIQSNARKKRVATLVVIAVAVAAIAVAAGVAAFFAFSDSRLSLGDSNAQEALTAPADGEPYYVLCTARLAPAAQNDPDGEAYMVVRIDEQARTLTFVTVPARISVELPDGQQCLLNEARTQLGDAELIRQVSELLDVPIAHFASTDAAGIARMVEIVGGVPVNLEVEVDDPRAGIDVLAAGEQTLDGRQAVTLLRASNFTEGLATQATNRAMFTVNLAGRATSGEGLSFPTVVSDAAATVSTDWTSGQIIALGDALRPLSEATVYACVVPGRLADGEGGQTYRVDGDELTAMMEAVRAGESPQSAEGSAANVNRELITVDVRNGAQVTGAAKRMGELLESVGYQVKSVGNTNDNTTYPETLVIYKDPAFEIAAKAIVSDLAAGRVVNGGDFYTFDTDVLVIIGQDWIPAGS